VPYIRTERRGPLDSFIERLSNQIGSPGELNYALTRLVVLYLDRGHTFHPTSYGDFATVTGVIENVKQELYRRLIAVYEDAKLAQHGDVYTDEPKPLPKFQERQEKLD
jgi:hypothetical protein